MLMVEVNIGVYEGLRCDWWISEISYRDGYHGVIITTEWWLIDVKCQW